MKKAKKEEPVFPETELPPEITDEKIKKERLKEAYKQQNTFNFLGFAIFDIIHIITGVAMYILLFNFARNETLDLCECVVETVLSVTLIGFVHSLAEDKNSEKRPAKYISYAWLLAISSLFIPTLFDIVAYFNHEFDILKTFHLVLLIVESVAYCCFFLSLFISRYSTLWKVLCYVGMLLFALAGGLEIACLINLNLFEHGTFGYVEFFIELVKNVAPFILAGFGVFGLYKVDVTDNGRLL